jgi:hypothetical protein
MPIFDKSLITNEQFPLKSVTTALGGSVTLVTSISDTGKERFTRIPCPSSVARAFIKRCKNTTKYLIPVWVNITRYDGQIICIERHPLGTLGALRDENGVTWVPDSVTNYKLFVEPMVSTNRTWMFDGRYIYCMNAKTEDEAIRTATLLTEDGKFRQVGVSSIDTQHLDNLSKITPTIRDCIAYVSETDGYAISTPIWKDISNMGVRGEDDDDSTTALFNLTKMNDTMSVNVLFALSCGKTIGELYGFDSVEPLQLPQLMLDLCTVNLPNLAKEIKSTHPIGISFHNCLAWLLGLSKQSTTLEEVSNIGALIKYLTKKGLTRKDSFDLSSIFVDGKDFDDIPTHITTYS